MLTNTESYSGKEIKQSFLIKSVRYVSFIIIAWSFCIFFLTLYGIEYENTIIGTNLVLTIFFLAIFIKLIELYSCTL
jgi:hypothetical protein